MKIKFKSDVELPLNKTIEMYSMIIVVRAVNKTSASKECDICHCWYFLNKGFKFQTTVCNRCHDLLMVSMNLSDIAILKIKDSDYHCVIGGISKREAINLMQNIDLTEKDETLLIKMGK